MTSESKIQKSLNWRARVSNTENPEFEDSLVINKQAIPKNHKVDNKMQQVNLMQLEKNLMWLNNHYSLPKDLKLWYLMFSTTSLKNKDINYVEDVNSNNSNECKHFIEGPYSSISVVNKVKEFSEKVNQNCTYTISIRPIDVFKFKGADPFEYFTLEEMAIRKCLITLDVSEYLNYASLVKDNKKELNDNATPIQQLEMQDIKPKMITEEEVKNINDNKTENFKHDESHLELPSMIVSTKHDVDETFAIDDIVNAIENSDFKNNNELINKNKKEQNVKVPKLYNSVPSKKTKQNKGKKVADVPVTKKKIVDNFFKVDEEDSDDDNGKESNLSGKIIDNKNNENLIKDAVEEDEWVKASQSVKVNVNPNKQKKSSVNNTQKIEPVKPIVNLKSKEDTEKNKKVVSDPFLSDKLKPKYSDDQNSNFQSKISEEAKGKIKVGFEYVSEDTFVEVVSKKNKNKK